MPLYIYLPAAGVEPAARARVAAAGALHHAAALLAGGTEVEAGSNGRDHRRLVGQRRGRRAAVGVVVLEPVVVPEPLPAPLPLPFPSGFDSS